MTDNAALQPNPQGSAEPINPDGMTADLADTAADDEGMGAAWDRMMSTNGAEHGADGKFASPNGKGKGAAATKPADKQAAKPAAAAEGADAAQPGPDAKAKGEGAAEGEGEGQAEPETIDPPTHLPQSTKDVWGKMPKEAQAEIARLTGEWDRKFGDLGQKFRLVKPIADRLTEATQTMPDFAGMSPEQLAQGAIELGVVQQNLSRNPVPTIIEIAKHYKVLPQLAALFTGDQQQGSQARMSAAIQQQLADLTDRVSKVSNPDTLRETVSMTLAEKDAETTLNEFAAGKEFFAEVEADLPYYIDKVIEKRGKGRPYADVLSDAYDMAIHASPELRVKVQAAEARATEPTPDPKRTADARRAASINVKSQSSGKDRQMTEDEAMSAAYDRAMAS